MMVRAAGAVVLDGLIGNVDLPRRTARPTSLGGRRQRPGSEATQTFGAVQLRAKTGSTYVDIYRTMFNQTSLDIEMLVRDDLAAAVQLGIDYAALHGDGLNNARRASHRRPGSALSTPAGPPTTAPTPMAPA